MLSGPPRRRRARPVADAPVDVLLPRAEDLAKGWLLALLGLAEAYRGMMQYITDNQLKMNGVYAESFLHIDFNDPASQITEIQIGLV